VIGAFDKVKGLLYGAQSTTFLNYKRKILENIGNPEHPPFYAWQCVSLILEERTVDFVITNEKLIMCFILAVNGVIQYNRIMTSQQKKNAP
jgi:hypothetical protein